jgi:hypothetical protein
MPRFHFELDDGTDVVHDADGYHYDSLDSAGNDAARSLADLVKSAVDRTPCHDMTINVRDECGSPVLRARLTLSVDRLN